MNGHKRVCVAAICVCHICPQTVVKCLSDFRVKQFRVSKNLTFSSGAGKSPTFLFHIKSMCKFYSSFMYFIDFYIFLHFTLGLHVFVTSTHSIFSVTTTSKENSVFSTTCFDLLKSLSSAVCHTINMSLFMYSCGTPFL
jgi:hypothetical protein